MNISMIGDSVIIYFLWDRVNKVDILVVYFGLVIEGNNFSWMDIYYCVVSKGGVVK